MRLNNEIGNHSEIGVSRPKTAVYMSEDIKTEGGNAKSEFSPPENSPFRNKRNSERTKKIIGINGKIKDPLAE